MDRRKFLSLGAAPVVGVVGLSQVGSVQAAGLKGGKSFVARFDDVAKSLFKFTLPKEMNGREEVFASASFDEVEINGEKRYLLTFDRAPKG